MLELILIHFQIIEDNPWWRWWSSLPIHWFFNRGLGGGMVGRTFFLDFESTDHLFEHFNLSPRGIKRIASMTGFQKKRKCSIVHQHRDPKLFWMTRKWINTDSIQRISKKWLEPWYLINFKYQGFCFREQWLNLFFASRGPCPVWSSHD